MSIVRTNSSTSVRLGNNLRSIRIWATPPRRLVFWDPENRKIFRHKDVIFNEKMYKNLLMERSILEKDPGVASRSNSESRMLQTRSSSDLMFM